MMNGTRRSQGTALILLLAATALTACGGGGGGGGTPTTPPDTVVFAGDPAGTISMLPGATVVADFDVEIRVNAVSELNAVALNVTFDSSKVQFVGIDSTGSVLGSGANFQGALVQGTTNEISVSGSMFGGASAGASVSGLLLTVQFQATVVGTSTLAVPANGAIVTRQVRSCPTPTTCTDLAATFTGGGVSATAGP